MAPPPHSSRLAQCTDTRRPQYPDRPYRLRAFGIEYVVFPYRFHGEIKRVPSTQASLSAVVRQSFHGSWSGLGRRSEEAIA